MRETLFRGKRVDNGEWVYGFYVQDLQGGHLILADEGTWWDGPVLDAIDVIPETVGQYTGLKDKNGVKIFESDIVTFLGIRWDGPDGDRVDYVGVVRYSDEHASFNFEIDNGLLAMPFEADDTLILGNIHDNPELMEPAD